ncbi:MAG: DegT/DnrJ/EryC1/StrS aminotransferase family protein [Thermoanaerobaculia bacterium]
MIPRPGLAGIEGVSRRREAQVVDVGPDERKCSRIAEGCHVRSTFLPFSPPLIGNEEIDEVVATLRSDWITTGPKVRAFEREFADYVGSPAALAVSSATDAMLVALAVMGLGPGDEVITSTNTFCSTVHVIEHLGARPVLVDVEPDTLNLDPSAVERAVTTRTRAIMPVHVYGHPCDMDAIGAIASRHGLKILEDAAHALPASWRGRRIGGIGDLTAFSFYATKNLTTGEGGMLTGDPELIRRARPWSLHGMSRDAYQRDSTEGSWFYEVTLPGFKCNMTDIQASIGIHQLRRLDESQSRRREIVRRYEEALGACDAVALPVERPDVVHAWHLFVVRLRLDRLRIGRGRFIEELKRRNIGASVHFIPIHLHPYYRDKYGLAPYDFPVAMDAYERIISLPLNLRLSDADVEDVAGALQDVAREFRR